MEVKKNEVKKFEPHPAPSAFHAFRVGIIHAEVCADSPDPATVIDTLEHHHPAGSGHRWGLSNKGAYPTACPLSASHYHYLFAIAEGPRSPQS